MDVNKDMERSSTPSNTSFMGDQASPVAWLNGQQVSPVDEDLSTYLDALECDPNRQKMRKDITGISRSLENMKVKKQPSLKIQGEKLNKRKSPYVVNESSLCDSVAKRFLCRDYKPKSISLEMALQAWVDQSEDKDKTKEIADRLLFFNLQFDKQERFEMMPGIELDSLPDLTKCSMKSINLYGVKIKDSFCFLFPPQLTNLNLSYTALNSSCKIVSLLHQYAHLQVLFLNENTLQDIPTIVPDHFLNELYLSNNAICDSSQGKKNLLCYPILLSLDLSNNPLGYIPQCSNTLTSLWLSNMNLKDDSVLVLNTLEQLKKLDLSDNFLTTIPELAAIKLQYLNMRGNKLKNEDNDFSLEKFTNLDILLISYNELTNIPHMNNNIKFVYMTNNQLVSNASIFRLEVLNNLEGLYLRNNDLTNLPFNFSTKLKTLDVSENHITQYDSTKRMVSESLKIIITGNPVAEHLSALRLLAPLSSQWEC